MKRFHYPAAWTACLLLLVMMTGLFASCGKKEISVTMHVADLPEDLDPQTTSDPAAELILINVMEGLTRLDASGKPVLAAADRCETSDDALTWRFHLKPSQWSDGEPVRPEDFVFAIQRLFDPATGVLRDAQRFSALRNSSDVMKGKLPVGNIGVWSDGEDVVFSLTRPEPDLPKLLAGIRTLPCRRDFFEKTAGSYGLDRQQLVYNGPYLIRYWLDDEYFILNANRSSAGKQLINRQVTLYAQKSEQVTREQFRRGDINLCFGRKSQLADLNQKKYGSLVYEDTVFCLAAQTGSGLLKDRRLRQALMLTLDRSVIPSENAGGYRPADALLPAALTDRPAERAPEYNPQRGRELLNAYLKEHQLEKLGALTVIMPENGGHREMLGLLQQNWQKELGVYVNLNILPDEAWQEALKAGDFELALMPVSAQSDDTAALLRMFLPGGACDCFGFRSTEFADALKRAEKASGEERTGLYGTCCEILRDSAGIAPLYAFQSVCVYDAELAGIEISPFGRRIYFASAGTEFK